MKPWVPAFALFGFVLQGCASATEVSLPSGSSGYSIACSGPFASVSQCLKKAGQQCPAGYDVVASNHESILGTPLTTSEDEMVIECTDASAE